MTLSNIADLLQILMFVASVGTFVIASVSRKVRVWIKSIFSECLHDFLHESDEK